MSTGESDRVIVFRGGKADHRGKDATEPRSLQGNMFRREGPETACQPNCREKQMKWKRQQVTESGMCTMLIHGDGNLNGSLIGGVSLLCAEASGFEEPGAEKLHAGIREGAAG